MKPAVILRKRSKGDLVRYFLLAGISEYQEFENQAKDIEPDNMFGRQIAERCDEYNQASHGHQDEQKIKDSCTCTRSKNERQYGKTHDGKTQSPGQ